MSESNQQPSLEIGKIEMQKEVLEEIVYSSVQGIDGVRVGKKDWVSSLQRVMGGRKFRGVKVTFRSINEVIIEVRIYVRYGLNIPSVSRRVQDAIKYSLERMTEVNIKEINVNVQGVDREV